MMGKYGFGACVCYLLSLTLLNTIPASKSESFPFSGFPDFSSLMNPFSQTGFVDRLSTLSPGDAFISLLEPVQAPNYPPDIIAIKKKLVYHIRHDELEVRPVLASLKNFQHLDRIDLLLAALLGLHNSLPQECTLSEEISKLIAFIMLQKQLSQPPPPPLISSCPIHDSTNCSPCTFEIIKYLIDRLVCAESKCTCSHGHGLKRESESNRGQRRSIAEHNFLLKTPVTLQKVSSTKVTEKVTEKKETNTYLTLMRLLPTPKNDEEKIKWELIKSFFESNKAEAFLKGFNLSAYSDQKELLYAVLKKMSESKIDANLLEAFQYFLHYGQAEAVLDLIARKEIKKHFDLTKIFSNTFVFNSLTEQQRSAFNNFYQFLSHVTGEQLHDFTDWSEAKTNGEFVKIMFKYFLNATFVPNDIKLCMQTLYPAIRMDGKGASPL